MEGHDFSGGKDALPLGIWGFSNVQTFSVEHHDGRYSLISLRTFGLQNLISSVLPKFFLYDNCRT